MKKLLTLKHWQLFIMVFAVPVVSQIILMSISFLEKDMMKLFIYLPFVWVISMGIHFCWFYSLSINLNKKLPETVVMSINKFRFFFFFPLLYFGFFFCYMYYFIKNMFAINPGFIFLIFPIHLFSMFCIFYCLYFISKSFRAAELQRALTFNDYAGEFFLIWFLPIGIWIIQPRINKLFENSDTHEKLSEV